MNEPLTVERLREALHYDPETGVFTWLVDRGGARKGSVAGCVSKAKNHGYRLIGLGGRLYRAHRLAWLYAYGAWPANHIDHVDGDRTNNSIGNLRECVWSENQQNRGVQRNNAVGLMGGLLGGLHIPLEGPDSALREERKPG